MAKNQRRRQKALEKKKSKRKAIKAAKRAFSGAISATRDIAIAARSSVHECLIPETLFELGIGNVIIAKMMPANRIGMGVFLLDVYCLGAKNVFYSNLTLQEYNEKKQQFASEADLEIIHPSCARKLIEGGVIYAEKYGLKPHRDYKVVKQIFGEIDPAACPKSFDYGRDGKPFYVSGPHDTPQKSEAILKTLQKKCGPDGYDYMIPVEDL
jgi:hypothetical protein